jgi:hypothetical protein
VHTFDKELLLYKLLLRLRFCFNTTGFSQPTKANRLIKAATAGLINLFYFNQLF